MSPSLLLLAAALAQAVPPAGAPARPAARLAETTVFDDALTVVMPVKLRSAESAPLVAGGAPGRTELDLDDAAVKDASLRLLRGVRLGAEEWDAGVSADASFEHRYLVFTRPGQAPVVLSGKFDELRAERETRFGAAVYKIFASVAELALKLEPVPAAAGPKHAFKLAELQQKALDATAHLVHESPAAGRLRVLYSRSVDAGGALSSDYGLVIVKEVTSADAQGLVAKWLKDKVLGLFVRRDKIKLAWPVPLADLKGGSTQVLELEPGKSLRLTLKGGKLLIEG